MPILSVIIPAYNKRNVLRETLQSIDSQSLSSDSFEVIIVDDGSTDGTAELVENWKASYSLRVIGQSNLGAGAARNAGARAASGEILVFIDADIVVSEAFLGAHLAAHEAKEGGMIVGRLLPWPNSVRNRVSKIFLQSFDLGSEAGDLLPRFGISGNLSIRADDFQRVGGFDGTLPRGQDIEFAHRVAAGGIRIAYQPKALAYHNHYLDIDSLCNKIYHDHVKLVALLMRYPQMQPEFVYLRDKYPVRWGQEPFSLIAKKMIHRAIASGVILRLLRSTIIVADDSPISDKVFKFLVWRLLSSYQLMGIDDGMREYEKS